MQQVLFHIPYTEGWMPPDGVPIHGFGVMLFITFLACVWFLGWRSRQTGAGLPPKRVQDLVIVVFVGGLAGARITYMIVEGVPWQKFFRIWEGGIVLYGGIITGMLAFLLFHRFVLKPAGVSMWKLADVAGPGLALGIALGRLGCFLNGCCYGHVAPEGCPASGFPTMTCPAADVVVARQGYQTTTGFTVKPSANGPQSIVTAIEPRSAAARAGLQVGDRIVAVNGQPNHGVLLVTGQPDAVERAMALAKEKGAQVTTPADARDPVRIVVDDPTAFANLRVALDAVLLFRAQVLAFDAFTEMLTSNVRGRSALTLDVDRGGQTQTIGPFTPRTIGLHPTQLYETISMLLLVVFLLAYYPFRAYDGQVFTLFIFIYAIHRFLNEALRNDTETVGIPALHMSLSQNISVLMILFALGLELGRRRWGPRLTRI